MYVRTCLVFGQLEPPDETVLGTVPTKKPFSQREQSYFVTISYAG